MGIKTRLNLMMFLEYAAKGLWFPLASVFLTASTVEGGLGFTQQQKGWIIGIPLAVGSCCAPFIGRLCDKRFATEKCLALLLFFVGVFKLITAQQSSFVAWMGLSVAFSILYVPTIALTNSLAMSHLADPKQEFPRVRVWGTLGWVAVAWVFPMIWLQSGLKFQWLPPFFKGTPMPDATARMLDSVTAAGVVCLVYAVYCAFALPKTPPKGNDRKFNLFEALALFRHRSFTVLMIAALLLSVVHTIYFMQMGSFLKTAGLQAQNVMPAMSLGQVSEILMLAILGPMLAKLGFRVTMAIGAGAFALRYFLFSMQLPVEAFVAAQTLHGVCFGCFYASAFIYVDRLAPVTVRHSAQALFGFVMYGLGPIIAAQVNGLFASYAVKEGEKMNMAGYGTYWLGTAVIALIATVLIGIAFRDESAEREG
ncbi:MAG: MFS transporter [Verrucomicrobiae bacterium]|nr:MFS transporter [Verrucomicrobiae bacterium]